MSMHSATTLLRCPNCGKHEDPAHPRRGPKATGAENRRHGKPAYHVRCQSCKWQWFSTTKRAQVLSQAVDKTIPVRHAKKRRAAA